MYHFKTASDPAMMTAAASPIPSPQVSTLAAPGKRGPAGMAPRVSNSRVNAGVVPAMDAGASEQKSVPPTGASMLQVKTAQRDEDRMATMMGRPSVQDMIEAAIAGTAERMSINAEAAYQAKLASETCSKCGKSPDECKCSKEDKSKPVEDEKTASAAVERLAAALEYASFLAKEGSIHISAGSSSGTGPGEGPNALHIMESPNGPPPGGMNMGTAIAKDIPPKNPPTQKGLTGPVGGGASLMKNDLERAPGGPGHQRTALPGAHKVAFAVTEKGHQFDAQRASLAKEHALDLNRLHQGYGGLGHIDPETGKNPATVMGVLRFGPGMFEGDPRVEARHQAYVAEQHSKGQNAWNPLGGTLTPVPEEQGAKAGLLGHFGKIGPKQKEAAPVDLILSKFAEIKKSAEDALNPAQISAGRTVPPDTRESGQAGPASPQGASMVDSAQSVTNLTRRDAKAGPKAEMRAYVDQPALSAAHDTVLQNAFAHTGQAGAKIASNESANAAIKTAAARAYLEQLVEEVKTAALGGK